MSEFDLEEITDRAGTGAPNFTHGFNINGSDSGISVFTHTVGATEPSSPSNGDTWWNTDNDSYHVYIDSEWKAWLGDTYSTSNAWSGDRGVFAGGDESNGTTDRIQYIDITTPGGSTDFGDLTQSTRYGAGASSTARGLHIGGYPSSSPTNVIAYVTISTPGNAVDFGNLATAFYYGTACSDGTRAFSFGGFNNSTNTVLNNIQQIVIATTGNATDVGDISIPSYYGAACSDATRAVFAIGRTRETATSGSFTYINNLEYITTASAGNSTDFGDTTLARGQFAACSDSTRGLFAGGYGIFTTNRTDTIDYITIQTTGNATDFGDLSQNNIRLSATSNATRGVIGGGYTTTGSSTRVNTIEYVTIQTPGNATDFGDLAAVNYGLAAFSGSPS